MTHTLDLFDTTIDATSMTPQDVFTSVIIFAVIVIIICILLSGAVALYRDHQDSHRSGDAKEPSIAPHVIIALAGLISFIIPTVVMSDAQTYSTEPTKRLFLKPSAQSRAEPTDPTKSLTALTHDDCMRNIDKHKDVLNDFGLDKKCNLLKSAADNPDTVSVLCGGYSLDEVETQSATLYPRLHTSADRALYDA